jgi:tRNA(adenine34) deaminase
MESEQNNVDLKYMRMALEEAQHAFELDEVPVGAVLVQGGRVIARAHNLCESMDDATAHAEMIALHTGARLLRGQLQGSTLYVTLEPCAMCTGAALLSRVSRIVFGAYNAEAGCCGSVIDFTDGWFDHSIEVLGGLLDKECAAILTEFFENKRHLQ